MTADNQRAIARAKTGFFLGLSALIVLLYYSVLRQHQMAGHEFAMLVTLTVAALLFDYMKVGQFFTVLKAQRAKHRSLDPALQEALRTTLRSPLLLKLAGTELSTLYYAFFARFERRDAASADCRFGYSKASNAYDVFLIVALSQLPFLPFIHVFLEHQKGPAPAWAVTLLTLWSVIWYLAQVEAVRFRPVELSDGHLKYRFGLFWSADISLANIKMARAIDAIEKTDGRDLFLSPLGSKRNVFLEFETPVRFTGPYLLKRRRRKAAISLDDPSLFLGHLASRGVATG